MNVVVNARVGGGTEEEGSAGASRSTSLTNSGSESSGGGERAQKVLQAISLACTSGRMAPVTAAQMSQDGAWAASAHGAGSLRPAGRGAPMRASVAAPPPTAGTSAVVEAVVTDASPAAAGNATRDTVGASQPDSAQAHARARLQTMRRAFRRRYSTGCADEYYDQGSDSDGRVRPASRRPDSDHNEVPPPPPRLLDVREAIRSGSVEQLDAAIASLRNVRRELMAQNAANGAGLLMLAVAAGRVHMLQALADRVKKRLGTTLFAKQLRYEDDEEKPLMFYAAASTPLMFRAVRGLVRDTIGPAGLAEQLRHQCARGTNILMKASREPDVFAEVWKLLERTSCLDETMEEEDNEGKNWILHAAEAGNLAVFKKLDRTPQEMYDLFAVTDKQGWSGFMYAARGKGKHGVDFLSMLCGLCFPDRRHPRLVEQLTREAGDDDQSTLRMHAAIGGFDQYARVCKMMREAGCADQPTSAERNAVLLSWAARGGDKDVLDAVAGGIKGRDPYYPDDGEHGAWHAVSSPEEAGSLYNAICTCAKRHARASLFLSAVESDKPVMIRAIVDGITARVSDSKACWDLMCGADGNPLEMAASKSVETFRATLQALQGVTSTNHMDDLSQRVLALLLPDAKMTPLCNAVFSQDTLLFDEVLKQARLLSRQRGIGAFDGLAILRQVRYAMREVDAEERLSQRWISAKMLAKVLEAAKEADKDSVRGGFEVSLLDFFMKRVVRLGAFDHVRALLKVGCGLAKYFPLLLAKIGRSEDNTSECIILAVTAASNPFVAYGIASQAIYEATIKRNANQAALERLHQKIGDLTLELLEHLPRSVRGVGEELARGDLDLQPFDNDKNNAFGKVKPSELLGFVVVGWMLEGSGQSGAHDASQLQGGENSLAQAMRSGPRALDFLSEALVLDYLSLKFCRTLPRWSAQKPFERNINQALYSYHHQARADDLPNKKRGFFQMQLLLLQGWDMKGVTVPNKTILPGLQFILAGVLGKPVSYYVVPAIRMVFIVFNYLATIGLYLSCVRLTSQEIPPNEWVFYACMLGVAWREALEFSSARKLEPGIGASIERYFYDRWNFLDVTTIVFVLASFVFRMMELVTDNDEYFFLAQFFLAATAPLLFSRVLFLSQVGSALGPMTQVIFNMLTQLVQFSLVLLLVMIGFAASFMALYGEDTNLVERRLDNCDVTDHPIVEDFGTLGSALLTMFTSMLGEFSFSSFFAEYQNADGEDCGGVLYLEAGVTLLVIYLVIMAVMLLNLLIAVLSTAHAEVQRNAGKEFQLARAKIILQSGEDVLNDVLPPPFNLIKPMLGSVWPGFSARWERSWEIATGTLHRLIFWAVVGLGALCISVVLWMVSLPLMTWKLSRWLKPKKARSGSRKDPDRQDFDSNSSSRPSLRRPGATPSQQYWQMSRVEDVGSSSHETNGDDRSSGRGLPRPPPSSPPPLTRRLSAQSVSFREDNIDKAIERVFFVGSDAKKGQLSPSNLLSTAGSLAQLLGGLALAAIMCFLVYPIMCVMLWIRGFGNVIQYAGQMRSRKTPWERRQVDLGEEEEWSVARAHAIRRNRRYWTANSSEGEFNVDVLLQTTTGMTMDDLRQNMATLKSAHRQAALRASLDDLMAQFPSDNDNQRL